MWLRHQYTYAARKNKRFQGSLEVPQEAKGVLLLVINSFIYCNYVQAMSDSDLEELAAEARLLKKFKAGKVRIQIFLMISVDCYLF